MTTHTLCTCTPETADDSCCGDLAADGTPFAYTPTDPADAALTMAVTYEAIDTDHARKPLHRPLRLTMAYDPSGAPTGWRVVAGVDLVTGADLSQPEIDALGFEASMCGRDLYGDLTMGD